MEPAYRRCCGIDVHKDTLTVTVLPPVGRSDVKTIEDRLIELQEHFTATMFHRPLVRPCV